MIESCYLQKNYYSSTTLFSIFNPSFFFFFLHYLPGFFFFAKSIKKVAKIDEEDFLWKYIPSVSRLLLEQIFKKIKKKYHVFPKLKQGLYLKLVSLNLSKIVIDTKKKKKWKNLKYDFLLKKKKKNARSRLQRTLTLPSA